MIPPYPLANEPGVHVLLVHDNEGGAAVQLATVSRHKAAAKWAELFESGADFEAQAWHGDGYMFAAADRWMSLRPWTGAP